MAIQTIIIQVYDKAVPSAPIEDVSVVIFEDDEITGVTQQVTNALGEASFLLDDVTPNYFIRFYKKRVVIDPVGITLTSPYPMTFRVTGDVWTLPIAEDPRMCRISGYLEDTFGKPLSGEILTINPIREPVIVGYALISPGSVRAQVVSDNSGYVDFSAYRKSVHDITLRAFEEPLVCDVPDLPFVPFVDFLLPIPVEITAIDSWSPSPGDEEVTPYAVLLSNGIDSANSSAYSKSPVLMESSDTSVVTVSPASNFMRIKAVAVGSATITLTANTSIFAKRLPSLPVTKIINITVS